MTFEQRLDGHKGKPHAAISGKHSKERKQVQKTSSLRLLSRFQGQRGNWISLNTSQGECHRRPFQRGGQIPVLNSVAYALIFVVC